MNWAIKLLSICAVCLVFSATGTAQAANNPAPEYLPPICTPQPCCYEACFHYKTHRLHKKVCPCDCCPPVKMVIQVIDPRCNCFVDVPVCVPACCKGVPKVSSRCGLFNRGIVEYCWCCGYKIKFVFRKGGHVDVHYYGL